MGGDYQISQLTQNRQAFMARNDAKSEGSKDEGGMKVMEYIAMDKVYRNF